MTIDEIIFNKSSSRHLNIKTFELITSDLYSSIMFSIQNMSHFDWLCASNYLQTLSITHSKNVKVVGLLSLNSQMFHIVVNHCQNVEMRGVKVLASGESPNTDGIHVQQSRNVAIFNTSIRTGDDCVSIGPGTQNLWIERMECGPGHGIR